MVNKKGFFFSFDAFLALTIFVLILISIYGYFIGAIPLKQQYYLAEDLFSIFSNVKISELNLGSYPNIDQLITDGKITDTNNTIMKQVLEFKENEMIDDARTFLRDLTDDLVPRQFGFGFTLDIDELLASEENANALVSRIKYISSG